MALSVSNCSVLSLSCRAPHNIFTATYTPGGVALQRTSTIKDLGIIVDRGLTFKPHINQIVQRAKSTWASVKRQAKEFNSAFVARSLYCTLVRPILEYCSVVWSPLGRSLCSSSIWSQAESALFGLVSGLRIIAACTFMRSLLLDNAIIPFQLPTITRTQANTRSAACGRLRQLPPGRTRYEEISPIRRCIAAYHNHLAACPSSVFKAAFKSKLRLELASRRRQRLAERGYLQNTRQCALN